MHTYKSKSRVNSFTLFLNDTRNLDYINYNNSLLISIAKVVIFNPIRHFCYFTKSIFNYSHIYFFFCCHPVLYLRLFIHDIFPKKFL